MNTSEIVIGGLYYTKGLLGALKDDYPEQITTRLLECIEEAIKIIQLNKSTVASTEGCATMIYPQVEGITPTVVASAPTEHESTDDDDIEAQLDEAWEQCKKSRKKVSGTFFRDATLEEIESVHNYIDTISVKGSDAANKLNKIKQIIAIDNSVIQEDVMKYKMICEVMNDDNSVS